MNIQQDSYILKSQRFSFYMLAVFIILSAAHLEKLCFAKTTGDLDIDGMCQPVSGNEAFFGGKKIFHTFHGRPVPLTFFIKGEKKKLKNPALVLYLPKSIKLLDIFQGKTYGKSVQYQTKRTKTRISEEEYYRYQTTSDLASAVTNRYKPSKHSCQIVVALDAPGKIKKRKIYWSLINNGKESAKKHIIVKFLDSLPVPTDNNEGQFRIMCFRPMSGLAYHSAALQKDAANLLLSSGIRAKGAFRKRTSRRGKFDQYLQSRGIALFARGFWGGPLWSKPVVGVPATVTAEGIVADRITKNKEGRKIVHVLSPVAALTSKRFKDYYYKKVKQQLKTIGPCEYAVFDYEPWQWANTYGFDQKTILTFANKYHIKTHLTPKIILSKYPKKWTQFWIHISTRAIAMMAKACRAANPDIKVIDYTYFYNYQEPLTGRFMNCPKDPSQYGKYVDGVMLSAYHYNNKGLVNVLRRSKRYIHDTRISIAAMLSRSNILQGGYTPSGQALSPKRMYQKTILSAAMGVKLFALWPGRYIDGAFYKALGKASRFIWAHEKFYYSGMNVRKQVRVNAVSSGKPAGGSAFAFTAQQLKGKRLVTLFNFTNKSMKFSVSAKHGSVSHVTVMPHGVGLVKISK